MTKYNYILWDWNGTIIDDVGVALAGVNHMLGEKALPAITLQEYRQAMGTPILRFYEKFFDMELTSTEWIFQEFHRYYDSHWRQLRLHAGVERLLREAKERGCHQVILSSSQTSIIRRYVEKFSLSGYFDDILGADDLLAASKIERALSYFRDRPWDSKETVLLGDTVHDFEVARELGIDCILFACGHQDRESLVACGCPVYGTVEDVSCNND